VSIASGLRSGLRVGLRSGLNPASADLDAAWNKYAPSSVAQFAALGIVTPAEIFLCQEPAGNLLGSVAAEVLAANGAPLYRQAVAGASRKGVRGDALTANQRFLGVGPNPTLTSVAVLLYLGNMACDATGRPLLCVGTSQSDVGLAGIDNGAGSELRYRNGGTIVDTVGVYGAGPRAALFVHDKTNNRAKLYTDLEKLTPAFGAPTAGTVFGLGACAGGTFAAITVMYVARFQGANAEALSTDATAKSSLQKLGFAIPW